MIYDYVINSYELTFGGKSFGFYPSPIKCDYAYNRLVYEYYFDLNHGRTLGKFKGLNLNENELKIRQIIL
jgi:hypothetical protein